MVRSLDLFQGSVRVKLLMGAGKVAAMKFRIVFLLAMIRQRLAGNLPTGNATAIRETRDKKGVDVGISLKAIQNRLNTFINKGYGSHLNANGPAGGLRLSGKTRGYTGSAD